MASLSRHHLFRRIHFTWGESRVRDSVLQVYLNQRNWPNAFVTYSGKEGALSYIFSPSAQRSSTKMAICGDTELWNLGKQNLEGYVPSISLSQGQNSATIWPRENNTCYLFVLSRLLDIYSILCGGGSVTLQQPKRRETFQKTSQRNWLSVVSQLNQRLSYASS